MYMYRTAVHNLDAEFTFLEMATSNAFFFSWAQDLVPFHTCFYLANVTDEINYFRVSCECVFGYILEPDQDRNINASFKLR